MESDLSKEDREKRFRTATMLAMATAIPIFLAAMNGEIKTKEDFKNVCGKVGDALEKMFLKTDKHVQDMNIAELK